MTRNSKPFRCAKRDLAKVALLLEWLLQILNGNCSQQTVKKLHFCPKSVNYFTPDYN